MTAPVYCEMPEMTNSASGDAVRKNCSGTHGGGQRPAGSVEQVGVGAADLLPQRLEAEPAGDAATPVCSRVYGGVVVRDELRRAGRHRQQLRLAAAVHAEEPERGLVDRLADGEQAVVLVDGGLAGR